MGDSPFTQSLGAAASPCIRRQSNCFRKLLVFYPAISLVFCPPSPVIRRGFGGFCAGISKHTETRKREEANGTKIFSICHAEILEKKKKITHYFHLQRLCYLRLYIYFFFFFLFVSLVNDFQEGVNILEKSKHSRF